MNYGSQNSFHQNPPNNAQLNMNLLHQNHPNNAKHAQQHGHLLHQNPPNNAQHAYQHGHLLHQNPPVFYSRQNNTGNHQPQQYHMPQYGQFNDQQVSFQNPNLIMSFNNQYGRQDTLFQNQYGRQDDRFQNQYGRQDGRFQKQHGTQDGVFQNQYGRQDGVFQNQYGRQDAIFQNQSVSLGLYSQNVYDNPGRVHQVVPQKTYVQQKHNYQFDQQQ